MAAVRVSGGAPVAINSILKSSAVQETAIGNANKIMMDPKPLFLDLYHPIKIHKTRDFQGRAAHSTRTLNPTKYFLIDFGLSRRYKEEDLPHSEPIIPGGDKSAPEHKNWVGSCDPFFDGDFTC